MAFDHNFARVLETADAVSDTCNDLALLHAQIKKLLAYNIAQEIDWSTPGSYITLDGDGNVSGRDYTPAQVSNALGTLDLIDKLLSNQSLTNGQGTLPAGFLNATGQAGDHLGNINHLAKPLG